MQRSRRALLQRRALEKAIIGRSPLYKVSLSLVILLWGLNVFLLSLWISHGDGYEGESPFEFPLCYEISRDEFNGTVRFVIRDLENFRFSTEITVLPFFHKN